MENGQFTNDEIKSFQQILKKYPADIANRFIYRIELYCETASKLKADLENQTRRDFDTNLEDMGKTFQKAIKYLEALQTGKLRLFRPETVTDSLDLLCIHDADEAETRAKREIRGTDLANTLLEPLKQLHAACVEEKQARARSKGRPAAISEGLIARIADVFEGTLNEKPTTYRDGIFAQICEQALDAVGLPSKEPMKIIRKILKSNRLQILPDGFKAELSECGDYVETIIDGQLIRLKT